MPIDRSTWQLQHNTEIGRKMADALPAGLYGKPTLEAFVRALGHGLQMLEDRIAERHLSLSLEVASGSDLDLFGDIVGERRDGLADADYRRFIAARLLANKSQGTYDELVRIAQLATGGLAYAFPFNTAPAYRHYIAVGAPLSDQVLGRVRQLLTAVKPAGVMGLLVVIVTGDLGDPNTDLDVASGQLGAALATQLYPS